MASCCWGNTHSAHGAAVNLEQELEERGIRVQLRRGQHLKVPRAALRPGCIVLRSTQLAGGAGSSSDV